MKRSLFFTLVALISTWLTAVAQPYVIQRMDVVIDVHENSSLVVTEQLQVKFNEPRRGIIRVIPYKYDTGKGYKRLVEVLDIQTRLGNGSSVQTKVWKESDRVHIRLGDPDVYLAPGTVVTYVIKYQVIGAFNWFEATEGWGEPTAELYWNATGDEWDTVIEQASCKVRFPQAFKEGQVRFRVYAGPYGSREYGELDKFGNDARAETIGASLSLAPTEAIASEFEPLAPGSGLTFVVSFPAQAIQRPPMSTQLRLFLIPNLGLLLPLIYLTVLWIVWWFRGRDSALGPVAVQYSPPDGLSGPEAGALLDERVDQRDIAAGIIGLATKGYIKIKREKRATLLRNRYVTTIINTDIEPGNDLTPFDAYLLERLREAGSTADTEDLKRYVAPHLNDLEEKLYDSIVLRGYYDNSPASVRNQTALAGLVSLGLLVWLLPSFTGSVLTTVVGGFLSVPVILIFAKLMPRRTQEGVQALRDLKGFEEFVRRVDAQEVRRLSETRPEVALFNEYLPHAVAFGATAIWVRAFADALKEPPSWYDGPWDPGVGYGGFAYDLERSVSSISTAAGTPPRSSGASGGSSGFSGGGFSGGGFGGGGGSSW